MRALLPLLSLLLALGVASGCHAAHAAYVPHDPRLRAAPLYFYPAADSARALLFFFGNDVGFWQAHQELAERFAAEGVDVVGFDVKKWLPTLPDGARHDAAFGAGVDSLVAQARAELHAGALPLLLGGHSIGAEFALWTAAHAPPAGLVGVLAMSPGSRSHLRITLLDLTNRVEPHGPDSFRVADAVRGVAAGVRIALVRGQRDRQYRPADSAIVAAGGDRLHFTLIPFAGHSMKQVTLAGPFVDRALDWLLGD